MDKVEEKAPTTIEEGSSQIILPNEAIYALIENKEKKNNKLFISVNYPEKTEENEYACLFIDPECKNTFQELKPSKGFNNIYKFDISSGQRYFVKSNNPHEIIFYYKYCVDKDFEQIESIKKVLKVKCLENKENKLKISFNYPYSKEVKFSTKYTIYLTEGKKKKYGVFKDEKIEGAKIIEGTKDKYETEIKIDSNKKDQFVYVVAEPKDSNVNLRPKIIYKGEKVPEAENKSDTIINIILVILIIITLIYKIKKKRKIAMEKKESNNPGNGNLA